MKFLNIFICLFIFAFVNSKAVDEEVNEIISNLNEENYKSNPNSIFYNLISSFNGLVDSIKSNIGNDASPYALSFMKSTDKVTVTEFDNYYFFDGPGQEKAFIFYQGALVDEKAYADIMFKLAENGLDCFLMKMPYRLAVNNVNMADIILNNYENNYKEFYMGGHSLGGAVSSLYTFERKDKIKGLALMASFSMFPLPENMEVVSFVASNDKVLVWPLYNFYRRRLPKSYLEVNIEGGNHGQFGDYGKQRGDGEASISVQQQHEQIIEGILNKFNVIN